MTKEIQLHGKYGQGKVALVDDRDFDNLSKYKWYVANFGYAYCIPKSFRDGGKPIFLHRMLMPDATSRDIDHVNGDPLDNRRANLREATRSQNNQNTRSHKGSVSKYKGVGFHKASKLWYADICLDGNNRRIGYFDTERQAAIAYNEEALKLFGEFARLNMIPDGDGPDAVIKYKKRQKTSNYKGVAWDSHRNLWAVQITYHHKNLFRRRYASELEAAQERDKFIRNNNLPLRLNFPG